jgi:hypothetical protein
MTGPSSDKVEIIDLLGRYAWYVNTQDNEGFAACFTEDGVWEGAGFGRVAGTEALRNLWSGQAPRNPHLPLNYAIDVDGDTASAHSDILIVGVEDGRWAITTVGAYDDKLVRVGGAWKIQYRKFTRTSVAPA